VKERDDGRNDCRLSENARKLNCRNTYATLRHASVTTPATEAPLPRTAPAVVLEAAETRQRGAQKSRLSAIVRSANAAATSLRRRPGMFRAPWSGRTAREDVSQLGPAAPVERRHQPLVARRVRIELAESLEGPAKTLGEIVGQFVFQQVEHGRLYEPVAEGQVDETGEGCSATRMAMGSPMAHGSA
jgi:hypothetical protein